MFNAATVHVIYADGSCLNCQMGGAGTPAFTSNPTLVTFESGGKLLEDGIDGIRKATIVRGQFSDAVWSARGELAVVRAGRVWVGRPPGRLRVIAAGTSPSWSPGGSRIAFQQRGRVLVVGARGGAARRLARGGAPAWSPDGRSIAYIGPRHALLVMPASGGRARRVGRLRAVAVDWQPVPKKRHAGCAAPPGSKVLASSPAAAVTGDSNSVSFAYMGCLRATGRERLLERFSDNTGLTNSNVSAAGVGDGYGALANESQDLHYGGSSATVAVFDLRTGAAVPNRGGESVSCSGGGGCGSGIDRVVVGPGGISAAHVTQFLASGPVTALPLLGISCPSAALCVAVDGAGHVLTSTDPTGGKSAWATAASPSLVHVSCPSASLCVGATSTTIYTSTDPAGGIGAWTPEYVDAGGTHSLLDVSCPAPSLCLAVDDAGNVLTSANPAGGPGAWTSADIDGTEALATVSCPSSSLCVATDYAGRASTSTDPTGGAGAWQAHVVASSSAYPVDVSCPSTTLCVATGSAKDIFTATSPGGAAPWTPAAIPNAAYALDCPSISLCVAVGDQGTIESSTAPGSGSWTTTHLAGLSILGSISCPTTALCVAGDSVGDIVTSTDPTGGAAAWTVTPIDVYPYATPIYSTTEQIVASDSTGVRTLDTATTSESSSTGFPSALLTRLSLSGATLRWHHAGTPRIATLR